MNTYPWRQILAAMLMSLGTITHAQPEPATVLEIEVAPDHSVRLSWSVASGEWTLEETPTLSDFSPWQEVDHPLLVTEEQATISLPASDDARFFRLRPRNLTWIQQVSPANGESGVAVTRETFFRFNQALAENTVLGNEQVYAEAAGRRLLSRVEMSSDRKTVTLFYLEPLPGSARVRVTFNALGLSDEYGRLLDLDGDGQPGDAARFSFDTLSLTAVPNTAVIGTVYAAEPLSVPNPDGTTNRPLAGVTITVDGREETMRAVTDENGVFRLQPCPAGEFFVHIDGRTVVDDADGVRYPDRAYYPFVGKSWKAVAGDTNNLAGGTGLIFLPRVAAGTLQPVSATEDTVVTFPPEVLAANPTLAGVSLNVPANALYNDAGVRGGRVGIAPVPPDRLPGPLPPGLEPSLVITVQTDGPLNFDRPVPVCFPNLPEPGTGFVLPPGGKQALITFNHDTGLWEAVGSMTVSEDGRLVCSDPGSGILAPGWGAVGPVPETPIPSPPLPPPGAPPCDHAARDRDLNYCSDDAEIEVRRCGRDLLLCLIACGGLGPFCFTICNADFYFCLSDARDDLDRCACRAYINNRCTPPSDCPREPGGRATHRPRPGMYSDDDEANTVEEIQRTILAISELLKPFTSPSQEVAVEVQHQVNLLIQEANTLAQGNVAGILSEGIRSAEVSSGVNERRLALYDGNVPPYPVHYVAIIRNLSGLKYVRGTTDSTGQYAIFVPRGSELEKVAFFDTRTLTYDAVFPYRAAGLSHRLRRFFLAPISERLHDADQDGLADAVEEVLGTRSDDPDSDSDGIPDGVEIDAGTDPLDGRPAVQGIIAAADTPGTAQDVCVEGDLAAVADGESGVAVFRLVNGLNPLLLAQIDTPGTAQAVACAEGRVAVANGPGGLAILDLVSGAVPALTHQITLGAAVTHVAASGNFAFAGLADNRWARVDLRNGSVAESGLLQEPLHDLAVAGDRLYFLTSHELVVFRIREHGLQRLGSTVLDFPGRLFVGDGLAYLGDPSSFTFLGRQKIVNVTDPNDQRILAEAVDPLPLTFDLAENGSGRLLTVSANAGLYGLLDYDSSDPEVIRLADNFLPSAGDARAVAIHRGLAYVAAGSAGLEIINFLAPDTQRQAPTVTLQLAAPEEPLAQGRTFQVLAPAADDVQVREVEFYVNDVLVARDGSYPFSAWLTGPTDVPGATQVRLRARAVDMAGNAGSSEEWLLPLAPLNHTPSVVRVAPSVGQRSVQAVTATFSGPLNAAGLEQGWLQVFEAGPDGLAGTEDDRPMPGEPVLYDPQTFELRMPYPSVLPPGLYQARISPQVQGASGDRLGTPFAWSFRVGNQLFWVNRQGGYWNEPQNWSEARLPEATDDVVIDVPDRVPIILDGLGASVRRLESHNRIDVRNTTLTVGQVFEVHDHLRLINGTLSGAHVVLRPGSQCEFIGLPVFDGVTIDGDLLLPPSSQLLVHNGFTLNGTMTLRTSTVVFDGTQTVHAGTFVLPEDHAASLNLTLDSVVTLAEAVVIRGRAGNIGFGHSTPGVQRFVHRGLIVADQPPLVNGAMVINGTAFKNEGTVEASNGGLLALSGAMRTADLGAPGHLRNRGGTLRLSGTLDNVGQELVFDVRTGDWLLETLTVSGGAITLGAGGTPLPNGLELEAVTVNGSLPVVLGGGMRVRHGLTLNGTIELGSTLMFEGQQTLAAGTIIFGPLPGSIGSLGLVGDTVVTLGAAVEMRGTHGIIGGAVVSDGDQRFIHQGSLQITGADSTFTIIGKGFRNEGSVEVSAGAALAIAGLTQTADLGTPGRLRNLGGTVRLSGTLDNAGQELVFDARTGDWLLETLTVSGGAITIGAGGTPLPNGLELEAVTVNGTLPVTLGGGMRVRHGLTLNGTIELGSTLMFEGQQTLAAGTIIFGPLPGSIGSLGLVGDTVVTLGAAVEMRGTHGIIGGAVVSDGDQRFIHQGTLKIAGADSAFTILGKGFRNEGSVEVSDGASLTIAGQTRTSDLGRPGRLRNLGGTVRLTGTLDNTSQDLVFNEQTGKWILDHPIVVLGGAITMDPGWHPQLGGFEFDGVTINGLLPIPASAFGLVRHGLTVNGTVELGGSLQFHGNQSFASGTISFVGSSGQLSVEGDTVLTIAAEATISGGSGHIGYPVSLPGEQRVDHFGLISANGAGSVIQINPAVFNNQGALEELNGGIISLVP